MKILTKYVLYQFIKLIFYSVAFAVALYVFINFFEKMHDFISNEAKPYDLVRYYFYKIPQIFLIMVPYAILLATVILITSLSGTSELVAMRAGGISLLSITSPILLASFFVTFILIVCNEFVIPYANQEYQYIRHVVIFKDNPTTIVHEKKIWYRSKDGAIWNVEYLDSKNDTLHRVHVFFYEEDKLLTKRIDASLATFNGKSWVFKNVYVRHFNNADQPEIKFFKKKEFQFDEKPESFYRLTSNPKEISISDINSYRKKLKKEGLDSTRFDVDFHCKFSYPFVCAIMAFIGIPFSLRSSRTGGVMFSCGVSTAIGWVYFYVYSMSVSLGYEGTFPPWLAAWGLNIITFSLGFYLILHIDTEDSIRFIGTK